MTPVLQNLVEKLQHNDYIFFTVVCVLEITYTGEKETG